MSILKSLFRRRYIENRRDKKHKTDERRKTKTKKNRFHSCALEIFTLIDRDVWFVFRWNCYNK